MPNIVLSNNDKAAKPATSSSILWGDEIFGRHALLSRG
jgi:hypothetical protein